MKVKLDDQEIYEIDERMFKMISDYLDIDIDPKEDIKRRLFYIIDHLCKEIYKNMKKEWFDKLVDDPEVKSIPANKEDFIDLVMKNPKYINREKRKELAIQSELEEKRRLEEKAKVAKKIAEEKEKETQEKIVPLDSEK